MSTEAWGRIRQESEPAAPRKRLIVAITGATGAIYGVRLLHALRDIGQIETHLVVSDTGTLTLKHELGMEVKEPALLAHAVHDVNDLSAPIASGSFRADGMVVAPCSMKTLASVAHGLSDNLIARAADVTLKERRRLILLTRETPLHLVHLRNMTSVTEMGGIIFPPLPSFYHMPQSVEQMVDHTVGRVLDLLGITNELTKRWQGMKPENWT